MAALTSGGASLWPAALEQRVVEDLPAVALLLLGDRSPAQIVDERH
jgi:hypothetical protein